MIVVAVLFIEKVGTAYIGGYRNKIWVNVMSIAYIVGPGNIVWWDI